MKLKKATWWLKNCSKDTFKLLNKTNKQSKIKPKGPKGK